MFSYTQNPITDVNMTSLSHLWHWWALAASTACVARLEAVSDWCLSWPRPTTLRACVRASAGHFQHTLWLSICFICTWWTVCFTPRLMLWVTVHYKRSAWLCRIPHTYALLRRIASS